MKRSADSALLHLAFEYFKDSLFTASDLINCSPLLGAIAACLEFEVSTQRLAHYLRQVTGRHGTLELKSAVKHDGRWHYQIVEPVPPLSETEKTKLQTLAVAEPHAIPAGVRALKRLGKCLEKSETVRAIERANFKNLQRDIARRNFINVEDLEMTTNDWLDIPEEDPFAPDPPTAQAVAVREALPLVEAVEGLSMPQREFLDCLVESRYDTVKALDTYRDTFGKTLPRSLLSAWLTEEAFVKAVTVRESVAARIHGVSMAAVYADLADIRRRNQNTGEKGDRLALAAIEMLAKALGMFKEPEDTSRDQRPGPALFIQLMSSNGVVITHRAGDDERVIPNMSPPESLVRS